jgi:hypothetical protein
MLGCLCLNQVDDQSIGSHLIHRDDNIRGQNNSLGNSSWSKRVKKDQTDENKKSRIPYSFLAYSGQITSRRGHSICIFKLSKLIICSSYSQTTFSPLFTVKMTLRSSVKTHSACKQRGLLISPAVLKHLLALLPYDSKSYLSSFIPLPEHSLYSGPSTPLLS